MVLISTIEWGVTMARRQEDIDSLGNTFQRAGLKRLRVRGRHRLASARDLARRYRSNVIDPSASLNASLTRHWCTNGRSSRTELAYTSSDLQYLNSYVTWYLQYNWHGDEATTVNLADGNGGSSSSIYGPWGGGSSGLIYYRWDGGRGYLC